MDPSHWKSLLGSTVLYLLVFFSCFWNFCSVANLSRGFLLTIEEIQTLGAVKLIQREHRGKTFFLCSLPRRVRPSAFCNLCMHIGISIHYCILQLVYAYLDLDPILLSLLFLVVSFS